MFSRLLFVLALLLQGQFSVIDARSALHRVQKPSGAVVYFTSAQKALQAQKEQDAAAGAAAGGETPRAEIARQYLQHWETPRAEIARQYLQHLTRDASRDGQSVSCYMACTPSYQGGRVPFVYFDADSGGNAYHGLLRDVSRRYASREKDAVVLVDFYNLMHGFWKSESYRGAIKPDWVERFKENVRTTFATGDGAIDFTKVLFVGTIFDRDVQNTKFLLSKLSYDVRHSFVLLVLNENPYLTRKGLKQDTDDWFLHGPLKWDLSQCGIEVLDEVLNRPDTPDKYRDWIDLESGLYTKKAYDRWGFEMPDRQFPFPLGTRDVDMSRVPDPLMIADPRGLQAKEEAARSRARAALPDLRTRITRTTAVDKDKVDSVTDIDIVTAHPSMEDGSTGSSSSRPPSPDCVLAADDSRGVAPAKQTLSIKATEETTRTWVPTLRGSYTGSTPFVDRGTKPALSLKSPDPRHPGPLGISPKVRGPVAKQFTFDDPSSKGPSFDFSGTAAVPSPPKRGLKRRAEREPEESGGRNVEEESDEFESGDLIADPGHRRTVVRPGRRFLQAKRRTKCVPVEDFESTPANAALERDPSLYKNSLCTFYEQGFCRSGAACTYAHGKEELRDRETGELLYPIQEEEAQPAAYKTKLCKFFSQGRTCFKGKDCPFAHSQSELQSRDDAPPLGRSRSHSELVVMPSAKRLSGKPQKRRRYSEVGSRTVVYREDPPASFTHGSSSRTHSKGKRGFHPGSRSKNNKNKYGGSARYRGSKGIGKRKHASGSMYKTFKKRRYDAATPA